jgi:hypothetical protein
VQPPPKRRLRNIRSSPSPFERTPQGLVVATDRDLVAVALDGSAPHRVDLEAYGSPMALSVGAGGERYVAIRRRPADGGGFVLLKVSDAPQ